MGRLEEVSTAGVGVHQPLSKTPFIYLGDMGKSHFLLTSHETTSGAVHGHTTSEGFTGRASG